MKSNWRAVPILLGLLICLPGFLLILTPDRWHSTARVEIDLRPDSRFYDLHNVEHHLEVIKSEFVLTNVVMRYWRPLDAPDHKLSVRQTAGFLTRIVSLEMVPDTRQVKISATTEDLEESLRIADAFAEAYCDRAPWWIKGVEITEFLKAELQTVNQQVKVAQARIDQLKTQSNSKLELQQATKELQSWTTQRAIIESQLYSSWMPESPMKLVHGAAYERAPVYPNRRLGIVLMDIGAIFVCIGVFLVAYHRHDRVLNHSH